MLKLIFQIMQQMEIYDTDKAEQEKKIPDVTDLFKYQNSLN